MIIGNLATPWKFGIVFCSAILNEIIGGGNESRDEGLSDVFTSIMCSGQMATQNDEERVRKLFSDIGIVLDSWREIFWCYNLEFSF
jgi:hypothetical protein